MKLPLTLGEEMCKIAFKQGFEMVRQRGSLLYGRTQREDDNNTSSSGKNTAKRFDP
ncbi:type II toxin-antitoxin system HicA family toxin [Methanosarcina horonobensis]|uniref:hypothetical protein n=1 Tax=Methanosarcina horonobensis TaxID=418008 RepID=UPI001950BBBD|nr:hypothetical protein [Methanosarcina horonobensis]